MSRGCAHRPTSRHRGGRDAGTSVSVIIPARNEATSLPSLLRLAGDARAASRRDPRRRRWFDGRHAPHRVGARREGGRCGRAAAGMVRQAVGVPRRCRLGNRRLLAVPRRRHALSLRMRCRALLGAHDRSTADWSPCSRTTSPNAPYEELSAHCNIVAMMGSGAFSPITPTAARVAFGACILTTAIDYQRVGGHAAVRGEIVEDVALAERYRAAALPVTCLAGGDAVRFRMYPDGFAQVVDGWSKNMAAGAARTDRIAAAATVLWVSAQVAVTIRAAVRARELVARAADRAADDRRGLDRSDAPPALRVADARGRSDGGRPWRSRCRSRRSSASSSGRSRSRS